MTKTRDEIEGERIRQLIADVERAQNERSPEDFLKHFMPDTVWVTAFGRRLTGRDEIAEFTRKVLTPALGNQYARYEAEHIPSSGPMSPPSMCVNARCSTMDRRSRAKRRAARSMSW
ncbi:SgcJ/EcaC family oxidoreductase [Ensifer canadensis]